MSRKSTPTLIKLGSPPIHSSPESFSSTARYRSRMVSTTLAVSAFTLQAQMYSCTIPSFEDFSESDSPQNSLITYAKMRQKLIAPPDSFSFAFILKTAANLRSLGVRFQLHCQALTHGLDTHLFVGTTLISMYAECGGATFAKKVFDEMLEPNVVAWNAVVTPCFR